MKNNYAKIPVYALLLGWLVASCLMNCSGQRDGAEEDRALNDATQLPETLASTHEYELWQLVVGEYGDGMFRGVSFGDTREKVLITENFEVFEDLPSQILYTHDTRELETIDVSYHFSEQQIVNGIVVDVFLNGTTSTDRLWQIAGWYFKNRYGEATEASDVKRVWTSKGVTTVLENVSKGMDYGLKITLSPEGKEALAKATRRSVGPPIKRAYFSTLST